MMGDISDSFSLKEFLCPCGRCPTSKELTVHPKLLMACQTIRNEEGVPIKVNSGARCLYYNQRTTGAAPSSWHIPRPIGNDVFLYASDITYSDPGLRTPENIIRLYVRADQVLEGAHGLGLYHGRIHLDFRPEGRARWVHVGWSWSNFSTSL